MGFLYYLSIGIAFLVSFYWIIPLIDNFSSVYPRIVAIDGMKYITESPLYSSLLETLKQMENIKKESTTSEVPLYSEYSSVIPDIIDPDTLLLYIFTYSSDVQFPAAPICTEIIVKKRSLHGLVTGSESWEELWSEKINGEGYLFTKSKRGQDIAIVVKTKYAQHQSQIIRYYPDYRVPKAYEFVLPGSNPVQSLSILNDSLVYVLSEGFYQFHYMKIRKTGNDYELNEVQHGELINRTTLLLTEVIGVRIVDLNQTNYLLVSGAEKSGNYATSRVLLNLFKHENNTWRLCDNLYNISIIDYFSHVESINLVTLPKIRVSRSDSLAIGYYSNLLMYISDNYFDAYCLEGGLSAEFSVLDITEDGQFIVLTIQGLSERDRIRFIKLFSTPEKVEEGYIDIALDHLPYSLIEKSIKSLKAFEYNNELYVVIFYSNGASVVIEFNNEISMMVSIESGRFIKDCLISFGLFGLSIFFLFLHRIRSRRPNN